VTETSNEPTILRFRIRRASHFRLRLLRLAFSRLLRVNRDEASRVTFADRRETGRLVSYFETARDYRSGGIDRTEIPLYSGKCYLVIPI